MKKIPHLTAIMTGAALAAFIVVEHAMGRIYWCVCGFGLWTGNAWGSDTSQHLADPYSASHLMHGIIFYAVLISFTKKLSLQARFLIALLIEIGWELLENSPLIIERYRAATASMEYTGDSILNSTGDILFALVGFWIAYRLPWKWTLALCVVIEVIMLLLYRDNLTLNVLMLLHPVEDIRSWQMLHG